MEALKVSLEHDVDIADPILLEAARSYQKSDIKKAVTVYEQLISNETQRGDFNMAAKHSLVLAELLDQDGDSVSAINHYKVAEDLYLINDNTSFADKCSLKLAAYDASSGNYISASERYEAVGMRQLNGLSRHSSTENFFRALMCLLAVNNGKDLQRVKQKLEHYENQSPIFSDSRQAKFIYDVCDAIESGDPQQISDVAREYDSVSRLDNQNTTILLSIRNSLRDVDLT
jgi:alpha-soluble NSF attachment protein